MRPGARVVLGDGDGAPGGTGGGASVAIGDDVPVTVPDTPGRTPPG